MLLLGIILLIIPSLTTVSRGRRIAMYVTGSILLIPSVYVAYIFYRVFRDAPGYTIDGLPLWEDPT
jgi:hypothetical protein